MFSDLYRQNIRYNMFGGYVRPLYLQQLRYNLFGGAGLPPLSDIGTLAQREARAATVSWGAPYLLPTPTTFALIPGSNNRWGSSRQSGKDNGRPEDPPKSHWQRSIEVNAGGNLLIQTIDDYGVGYYPDITKMGVDSTGATVPIEGPLWTRDGAHGYINFKNAFLDHDVDTNGKISFYSTSNGSALVLHLLYDIFQLAAADRTRELRKIKNLIFCSPAFIHEELGAEPAPGAVDRRLKHPFNNARKNVFLQNFRNYLAEIPVLLIQTEFSTLCRDRQRENGRLVGGDPWWQELTTVIQANPINAVLYIRGTDHGCDPYYRLDDNKKQDLEGRYRVLWQHIFEWSNSNCPVILRKIIAIKNNIEQAYTLLNQGITTAVITNINKLRDIGFHQEEIIEILGQNNNNYDNALMILQALNVPFQQNPELEKLINMGFSEEQSIRALEQSGNNLANAIDVLLSQF